MLTKAQEIAADLKVISRDFLIEHVHGPVPIARGEKDHSRAALLRRHLIRYQSFGGVTAPKNTIFTDLGREVTCVILGQYAEQLIASQRFLEKMANSAPGRNYRCHAPSEMALAKIMADG